MVLANAGLKWACIVERIEGADFAQKEIRVPESTAGHAWNISVFDLEVDGNVTEGSFPIPVHIVDMTLTGGKMLQKVYRKYSIVITCTEGNIELPVGLDNKGHDQRLILIVSASGAALLILVLLLVAIITCVLFYKRKKTLHMKHGLE